MAGCFANGESVILPKAADDDGIESRFILLQPRNHHWGISITAFSISQCMNGKGVILGVKIRRGIQRKEFHVMSQLLENFPGLANGFDGTTTAQTRRMDGSKNSHDRDSMAARCR